MKVGASDDRRRVAALRRYGILDTPREQEFDEVCELAAYACKTPIAIVNFVDEDRQWFKGEVGLGLRELPLENSLCSHAIIQEETLVVPDTALDERFRNNPLCLAGPGIRSYAGAVIRDDEGFALGTVCVLDTKPRTFEDGQLQALRSLARQVMIQLTLRRQTQEARELADMRSRVSARLGSTDQLSVILRDCAQMLVDSLGGAFARIWTLEKDADTLILRASAGLYTHLDGPHGRVKVGDYKIGRIARNRQSLLTNDVQSDPNISDPEWAAREGMEAFAGYPLLVEARVVGVLAIFWQKKVSELVLTDLAPVADGIAQCIGRKTVESALERREEMAQFLSRASSDLAEVIDHQSTLQRIASTSIPAFADWCTIDMREADGRLHRLAVAHSDPHKTATLHSMRLRFPPTAEDTHGIGAVTRTGEPQMVEHVTEEIALAHARNDEHREMLREVGFGSFICVPISWRGKVLGTLSYAYGDQARQYNELDLAVATDLARRAAVAVENAHLYSELRDADRYKDEFLATLSHELRNPLAPLRNALSLLREGGQDARAQQETREIMERQLQQMVRLVDDLLDVSRITRDRIRLQREVIRLDKIVLSAVEISRALIDRAAHTLEVKLPPEPILLHADAIRLAQVFSNLLNNAAKYTNDGGHIVLSARLEGKDQVRVSVQDTGSGIDAAMLPKVFELFAQEDRSLERAQGGLGIGLSLVRRLVHMHGGEVEASSPGRGLGSEFIVILPLATLAEIEAAKNGAVAKAPITRAEAPTHRILVVDDNRDAAMTLTRLLQRRGHEVETVFDGEEAVRAAARFRPEVVLLDIGLPKLNGYEAAEQIREQSSCKNLLLIALTGWGQEDDLRRAREAGFTHHLVKPVVFEDLLALL